MASKRKTKKARGQFSDATRAKIFAWDRAVCALTGANLWMLDYGLSGMEQEDWADHIKPAARGGKHVAENGVCTSAGANFAKNANGRVNEYWYIGGRPTCRFYSDLGKVPEATARWLRREVLPSDWYFNRSLRNFTYAVAGHGDDYSEYKRHADRPYYPHATLRFLNDFRETWVAGPPEERTYSRVAVERDWQARGLLLTEPWPEQREMLELLELETLDEVDRLAEKLSARYAKNLAWFDQMDTWTANCDPRVGERILADMSQDEGVSPFVKDTVSHNIHVLGGLPTPPPEEASRETTRRWGE